MFLPKNLLKYTCAVLCTILMMQHSYAQKAVGNPMFLHMHDKMVEANRYSDIIDGTPFYKEDWQLAAVMLENNILVENVKVRINLLDNEIHYLDSTGAEMISTQHIKSIIFKNSLNDTSAVFVSGYAFPGTDALPATNWMQLLAKGKASLLKQYDKKVAETKGYSSATIEKNILTETKYFVWYKNTLTRVKNGAEITDLLQDPKMQASKKNAKSEAELKAVIDAFNSL